MADQELKQVLCDIDKLAYYKGVDNTIRKMVITTVSANNSTAIINVDNISDSLVKEQLKRDITQAIENAKSILDKKALCLLNDKYE